MAKYIMTASELISALSAKGITLDNNQAYSYLQKSECPKVKEDAIDWVVKQEIGNDRQKHKTSKFDLEIRKLEADTKYREQMLAERKEMIIADAYDEFFDMAKELFEKLQDVPKKCNMNSDQDEEFTKILKDMQKGLEVYL